MVELADADFAATGTEVSCATTRNHDPAVWALLVQLSMLWGGAFFFVGVAVVELPPLTSVACQLLVSSTLIMTVVVAIIDRP